MFELQQQWVVVGIQFHLHGVPVCVAARAACREEHPENVDPAEVMQLHNVQDEATETDTEHEVEKDGFLGGSRHEAVSSVRTGVGFTAEKVWDFESKEVILPNEEDYLHDGAQQHMYDVDEQHLAGELGRVLPYFFHFLLQLTLLFTLALPRAPGLICVVRDAALLTSLHMSAPFKRRRGPGHHFDLLHLHLFILGDFLQDIDNVENRGCGYEDDLKDPKSQVGHRSEGVVAHVVAPGLEGVAGELGLLVTVDGVTHQGHEQDAEDEQHCQPYLTDDCGVVLNLC